MTSMKTMMVVLMITLFGLLPVSQLAHAEIYKWVDEKGTAHFTDDIGKIPEKYRSSVPPTQTESSPATKTEAVTKENDYVQKQTSVEEQLDSFRGIKWGSNIKELSGFNYSMERKDKVKVYTRIEEKKMGDVKANEIIYLFFKDRFFGSIVTFKGYDSFSIIKEGLFQKYGKWTQGDPYTEKYHWTNIKGGTIWIILDCSKINEGGTINYYFRPILSQFDEEQRKKGGKAKEGL